MMHGVSGFVGPNGSGKTLCMMAHLVAPSIAKGRPILINTPLFATPADAHLPWYEREPHPLYVPLVSWRQLNDPLGGCTIGLDEITAMFDSRESARMPVQIASRFQQLRKLDNLLGWTSPGWEQADKRLRRPTTGVYLCSGHRSQRVEGRMWRQNRVFKWRLYNSRDFDEFSEGQAKSQRAGTIRPEMRWKYRRERHDEQYLYDTLAPVHLLDHLDEYGNCFACGGTRRRPKCECDAGQFVRSARDPLSLAEMKARALEFIEQRPDTAQQILMPSAA